MREVKVTKYVSFDDKVFDTPAECCTHEEELKTIDDYMENHRGSFWGGDGQYCFSDGLGGDDLICPMDLTNEDDLAMLQLVRKYCDDINEIPDESALRASAILGEKTLMLVRYSDHSYYNYGTEQDYLLNSVVPMLMLMTNANKEDVIELLRLGIRYTKNGIDYSDKHYRIWE